MKRTVALRCSNCGKQSEVALTTRSKGSLGVEVLLWFCFLAPGLVYSLWRRLSRQSVAICPKCQKPTVW